MSLKRNYTHIHAHTDTHTYISPIQHNFILTTVYLRVLTVIIWSGSRKLQLNDIIFILNA